MSLSVDPRGRPSGVKLRPVTAVSDITIEYEPGWQQVGIDRVVAYVDGREVGPDSIKTQSKLRPITAVGTGPCTRCNGKGFIPGLGHVQNGICFGCGGKGTMPLSKPRPRKLTDKQKARNAKWDALVESHPEIAERIQMAPEDRFGFVGGWSVIWDYLTGDMPMDDFARAVEKLPVPADTGKRHNMRFEAGPGGGVIPWRVRYQGPINLKQPRPVVLDPMAIRDMQKVLYQDEQKKVREAIDLLEAGRALLEPKQRELVGTFGIRIDEDCRMLVYPHIDGAWHAYYMGRHDYDEAQRRMAPPDRPQVRPLQRSAGVKDTPVEQYGLTYRPGSESRPAIKHLKGWGGWDDLPVTRISINPPPYATEPKISGASVEKVVSGQEPFRDNYVAEVYIDLFGDSYMIDGNTRMAMYLSLGMDSVNAKVWDARSMGLPTQQRAAKLRPITAKLAARAPVRGIPLEDLFGGYLQVWIECKKVSPYGMNTGPYVAQGARIEFKKEHWANFNVRREIDKLLKEAKRTAEGNAAHAIENMGGIGRIVLIGQGGNVSPTVLAEKKTWSDHWRSPSRGMDNPSGHAPYEPITTFYSHMEYGTDEELNRVFAEEVAGVTYDDRQFEHLDENEIVTIYRGMSIASGVDPTRSIHERGGAGNSWTLSEEAAHAIAERGMAGFSGDNRRTNDPVWINARGSRKEAQKTVPVVMRGEVMLGGEGAAPYRPWSGTYTSEIEIDLPTGTEFTMTGWRQAKPVAVNAAEKRKAEEAWKLSEQMEGEGKYDDPAWMAGREAGYYARYEWGPWKKVNIKRTALRNAEGLLKPLRVRYV